MLKFRNENGFHDSRVEPGYFEDLGKDKLNIEGELRELRMKLIEEVCGSVEDELSVIEDGFWHPEDLDTDRIISLMMDGVKLANDLKTAHEAWDDCEVVDDE